MSVDTVNPSGALVRPSDTPDVAPAVHIGQHTDLVAWAEQAQAAYRVGQMICETEFAPAAYKKNPEKCAAAMMAGAELGFSPMQALNAYDVIQGTPALKARTMRAIVQAAGHHIREVQLSPERVVIEGHRRGMPENLVTVEWTIDRATKAGYVKKNEANYTSKPQEMLTARATAELCRLIAADALLGIPFTSEELQDDPSIGQLAAADAKPTPAAARRGETTMDASALTGEVVDDDAKVTKEQLRQIAQAFRDAGVQDRATIARIVNDLSDVEVAKATDLTEAGAAQVLERLAEKGVQGIRTAANPQPVDEPEVEEVDDADVTDDVEGHDPADDTQGQLPVEEPPAWPETTQPGTGGRKK